MCFLRLCVQLTIIKIRVQEQEQSITSEKKLTVFPYDAQVGQGDGKPFGIPYIYTERKPLGYGSTHGALDRKSAKSSPTRWNYLQILPPVLCSRENLYICQLAYKEDQGHANTDLITTGKLACVYTLPLFGFANSMGCWCIGNSSSGARQGSRRLPHGESSVWTET